MTRLEAQRRLHQLGQSGNWRFKGLMLAALPSTGVNAEDVAKAWPSTGQTSDYRFLSANPNYDAESEAKRGRVASPGDDAHRMLKDFATEEAPKTLGASKAKELDNGDIQAGVDDAIKRTLFSASTFEEVDTLFREQLVETVERGAERRKIARDASNVINADTRRGDVPVGQDEPFAPSLSQGGEIRDDRENYTTVQFDTTKHGQGARITDEMVDHAMIDIIERQIEYVGAAVENSINRSWLNTLVDEAGNDFESEDGARGVPAINGAYGEVDNDDFVPDTFVTHPEYRTTLFDDSNIAFANRAGTDDVVRERVFDPLLSVEHFGASDSVYDGEDSWGFSEADDKGAVVYDRDHIHVVMYNPAGNDIEVKDYEDPVRDLQGVNARVHHDTIFTQGRAASTVSY